MDRAVFCTGLCCCQAMQSNNQSRDPLLPVAPRRGANLYRPRSTPRASFHVQPFRHPAHPVFPLCIARREPTIVVMAANASFVSPSADAKDIHLLDQFDTAGLLSSALEGFTLWRLALTLIVSAIAYDQCMHSCRCCCCCCYYYYCCLHHSPLTAAPSQVPLEQGLNCWPVMEDSFHRALP